MLFLRVPFKVLLLQDVEQVQPPASNFGMRFSRDVIPTLTARNKRWSEDRKELQGCGGLRGD